MVATGASGHEPSPDLLLTVERLEKRIRELEEGTSGPHREGRPEKRQAGNANGGSTENGTHVDTNARVTVLLGKGQSLLNVDKPEEALACFDEVLALEAHNPEALVKKGAALERLRKLNEAIECYDHAIQADNTMTIAYLYKGGLFNRMERFNEALECYEQALRTQEKRAA
jgi:tetratricopeptide (TPR) repeat protein